MKKEIQPLTFTDKTAHLSDPFLVMMKGIFDNVDRRKAEQLKKEQPKQGA